MRNVYQLTERELISSIVRALRKKNITFQFIRRDRSSFKVDQQPDIVVSVGRPGQYVAFKLRATKRELSYEEKRCVESGIYFTCQSADDLFTVLQRHEVNNEILV